MKITIVCDFYSRDKEELMKASTAIMKACDPIDDFFIRTFLIEGVNDD